MSKFLMQPAHQLLMPQKKISKEMCLSIRTDDKNASKWELEHYY
jgi:hypothetical protein